MRLAFYPSKDEFIKIVSILKIVFDLSTVTLKTDGISCINIATDAIIVAINCKGYSCGFTLTCEYIYSSRMVEVT